MQIFLHSRNLETWHAAPWIGQYHHIVVADMTQTVHSAVKTLLGVLLKTSPLALF